MEEPVLIAPERFRREGSEVSLSVVVLAGADDVAELLAAYRGVFDALGEVYEVLCMVDASGAPARTVAALAASWPELVVFERQVWAGEDSELAMALRRARGATVLTLPGWAEISTPDLEALLAARGRADMVVAARRHQPVGATHARILARGFRLFFGQAPADLFCRVRLARRAVLEEVATFGVRQHFVPVIATKRGYSVAEQALEGVSRSAGDDDAVARFVFRPLGHIRAFFDAVTLFVVLKFLHRPLRFFGAIGAPVFAVGFLVTAYLGVGRLLFGMPLADRPLLILSTLMLVFGLQIIALGLIGEIIIYAGSRNMRAYRIERLTRRDPKAAVAPGSDRGHPDGEE